MTIIRHEINIHLEEDELVPMLHETDISLQSIEDADSIRVLKDGILMAVLKDRFRGPWTPDVATV
jgi:hypothetical protein